MRLYRTLGDGADPLAAPQKSTGSVTRISELWAYFWGPFLEIGQSWGTLRCTSGVDLCTASKLGLVGEQR